MAGIYIHIPFCKQACNYCNFYFNTSTYFQEDFINALIKEIGLQKNYLSNETIKSIYFGGGTPSIIPAKNLRKILDAIYENFSINDNAEITLEANPDDLTKEKLKDLKQLGINRLSIGIQSFYNEDLQYMNRAHNAKEALDCLHFATQIGFNDISIDLIYGVPTQNSTQWKNNLNKVLQYNINHLSCYALTVEEQTPLYFLIRKGKVKNVDDAQALQDFTYLQQWAKKNNWQHYEISNLSKTQSFSKHNTSYWKSEAYLGLGPSAHSYNGKTRQWNVANLKKYIDGLNANTLFFEQEVLRQQDKYNEYIMTALRTSWGIDINFLKENYMQYYPAFNENLKTINPKWVNITKNKITLSDEGMFYADGIAAALFEL